LTVLFVYIISPFLSENDIFTNQCVGILDGCRFINNGIYYIRAERERVKATISNFVIIIAFLQNSVK